MTASDFAQSFIDWYIAAIVCAVIALFAGAFCLWVREQFKADKTIPEPLDFIRNDWIKRKEELLR